MKLCTNCLQELFDSDNICVNCGNCLLINKDEFDSIKKELVSVNKYKRKKLIDDKRYNSVYSYLIKKNGERYWKDVDNKSVSTATIYPTSENIKPIPRCPTCQSTNINKITITSKAMNTALFGLFGTKRHKTFHCNSCGYEW